MTRYAVLGTGALGGLYGGLLARGGCDVHFLLHSDYEHVRQHGLRVDTPLGDFHLPQVQAYADVADMPPADVVLVAWKSTINRLLPSVLPQVLADQGIALVLQNGWDIERDTADVIGPDRVLGGCCFLCSNKVGPGHIRHIDYGKIIFGEYSPRLSGSITPRMEALVADFTHSGIDLEPTHDLRRSRWTKLMWNIPFNGLSVVLDAATDSLMADEQAAALAAELMDEVRATAAGCGTDIPASTREHLLDITRRMVPYASSMLIDYQQRRPMEVEAIVGRPLRAAQAAGVATPRIEMLYRQLSFLNRQRLHQAVTSSPAAK
jgi:2-dehydropantoate 2-reductase